MERLGNDADLDRIEIGPAVFPVVRVACEPDHLVAPEFDEPERSCPDRLGPHVTGRDVAGIDRGVAGRQHGEQGWLRLLELERDLEISVQPDVLHVLIPDLARIEPQPVLGFAEQQVEGAADVLGGERLAVMPFHALAQLERDPFSVLAPAPALGQIRNDRVQAVARGLLWSNSTRLLNTAMNGLTVDTSPPRGSRSSADYRGDSI